MSRIYTTINDLINAEITPALDGVEPGFDMDGFVQELWDRDFIVWDAAECDDCGGYDGPHEHLDRQGFRIVTDDEDGNTPPPAFWELVEAFCLQEA